MDAEGDLQAGGPGHRSDIDPISFQVDASFYQKSSQSGAPIVDLLYGPRPIRMGTGITGNRKVPEVVAIV